MSVCGDGCGSRSGTRCGDVQESAIPAILAGNQDVLLSASTASGKTEAAFLPICTRLVQETEDDEEFLPGVRVLYVSPLKALINDQFGRLEGLCERLEIPVHRWHGDVSQSKKSRLLAQPSGILLITPESLEALFVRRGTQISRLFGGLRYIVVDEIHGIFWQRARAAVAIAATSRRCRAGRWRGVRAAHRSERDAE